MLSAVLLCTFCVSGQETKAKKDFRFDPLIRVGAIYPIQFGDHSLSDAHRSNPGFEFSMSFFNFKNFRLAAGFDRVQYNVQNHQLVGNFANSNYTGIYGEVSYEFLTVKKISLLGDVGFGYANVQQASGTTHFGNQEGNEFRVGAFADFRFAKRFSVFAGAHYIGSNLNMQTNAAYVDYYGKATQIQVTLGIKVN